MGLTTKTMSAHTPGQLHYDYVPGYCGELLAENGTSICSFTDEPTNADARRLAACWNACDGLSTEALETEGSAVMGWTRTASKLMRATTQRDELLKALQSAVDALDALTDKVDGTGFSSSPEFNRALDEIDLARAVIAKATEAV